MSGSIRRVAIVAVACLFVSLNVGAATAQMKLNMPTRNQDQRTEEQKRIDAERQKALDEAFKKAGDSHPRAKGKTRPLEERALTGDADARPDWRRWRQWELAYLPSAHDCDDQVGSLRKQH